MGKRVFISYSHQDSVCAKGIARFLTRQGYDVWIDVDKLVVGQSWANNINEALQTADMMIALISKNSVRRMEYYVKSRKHWIEMKKMRTFMCCL